MKPQMNVIHNQLKLLKRGFTLLTAILTVMVQGRAFDKAYPEEDIVISNPGNIEAARKSTDRSGSVAEQPYTAVKGEIYIAGNTTVIGWEHIRNYKVASAAVPEKKPLRKTVPAPRHNTRAQSPKKQEAPVPALYTYHIPGRDFFNPFTGSKQAACMPSIPAGKAAVIVSEFFTLVPHSTYISLDIREIHIHALSGVWQTGPSRGPPAFF